MVAETRWPGRLGELISSGVRERCVSVERISYAHHLSIKKLTANELRQEQEAGQWQQERGFWEAVRDKRKIQGELRKTRWETA